MSDIPKVDVVITMGCNVQFPCLPCSHRKDWSLEDPSGKHDNKMFLYAQVASAVELVIGTVNALLV